MPVNNPAPAIKPPRARDTLREFGGSQMYSTYTPEAAPPTPTPTSAPGAPPAPGPMGDEFDGPNAGRDRGTFDSLPGQGVQEGAHMWKNPYETDEQRLAYLDRLRASGGANRVDSTGATGAEGGAYNQDWANAEAARLERAWGLEGGASGQSAASAAAGAGAPPVQPGPGDQGGADIVNDMMTTMQAPGGGFGGATPAGGDALNSDLTNYGRDSLNAPGRYGIPLVQQAIDLIDQDLEAARTDSVAALDEFNAQRGTVGSSFERQDRARLEGDLNRQRMERLVDLQERIAQTTMQDRKTASDIATDIGRFGLDQQTVNLRAQELQQQAALEGRALDIEEARLQAQNEQFQANLAQRQNEFAAQMGLEGRRLQEQARQFSMSHAEAVAGRLQQESQFARSLDSEESRFAMQIGLEQRALDLQEQGMEMDEAFRRAELDLQDFIERRSLELQERGMAQDEAYRYAALESQNEIAREQLRQGQQTIDNTNRLSQLDIILRGLASGLDPDEIGQYLDQFFSGGGGAQTRPGGTTQTGGGAPTIGGDYSTMGGSDQTAALIQALQQMRGG